MHVLEAQLEAAKWWGAAPDKIENSPGTYQAKGEAVRDATPYEVMEPITTLLEAATSGLEDGAPVYEEPPQDRGFILLDRPVSEGPGGAPIVAYSWRKVAILAEGLWTPEKERQLGLSGTLLPSKGDFHSFFSQVKHLGYRAGIELDGYTPKKYAYSPGVIEAAKERLLPRLKTEDERKKALKSLEGTRKAFQPDSPVFHRIPALVASINAFEYIGDRTRVSNNTEKEIDDALNKVLIAFLNVVIHGTVQVSARAATSLRGTPAWKKIKRKNESPFNTVLLRRAVADRAVTVGHRKEVEWACKWLVRAHWRNQYYPSTGEHHRKLILPYIKGPEDKPLVRKKKIFKAVR